ncbi:MAG: sialate O-acetylesterase [Planctomycetota bacterium]|jgi:hypothetical protein|nr:sialate O-acetylesterase [Planctomycetota bacterium]
MKRASLVGVWITQGPADWQIVQRRLDNTADLVLTGTWLAPGDRLGTVEIRLVDESRQCPAAKHLDWTNADSNSNRTWRHVIENIPAGGLYRLETRLRLAGDPWPLAGDQIHHLGVGDLWIIAGDDNAVGFGRGAVDDQPELGVHLFRLNERWTLASHPIHDSTGIRKDRFFSPSSTGHSPWLSFARLIRRGTGIPIGLIPAANEGSSLDAWHNRKRGGESPALANLLSLVHLASSFSDFANFSLHDGAISKIKKPVQPPGAVAGCVWHQGYADCRYEGMARNYRMAFREFAARLRTALEAPRLPLIICQLNRVIGVGKIGESNLWGVTREAQRAAGYDIDFTAVIPTLDAGLSDGLHNSSAGNMLVGERAAQAALGLVYGKNLTWRFPDFKSAWFEKGKRNQIALEFEHVSGELRPVAGEITSFTVTDTAGGAPIRKIVLTGKKRILIQLNRELKEKPVISFCSSHNPALAFVDDNNCPPLAFANVAIMEDE